MIFTVAGDFALSQSRGEPRNWMIREKEIDQSLKKQILLAMKRKLHFKVAPFYRNYPVIDIQLPEYNRKFKEPFEYEIPEDSFCNVAELFTKDGLNFLNLESPFTNKGRHIGDHKSNPEYLNLLKKHNISIVSVANNHAFDQSDTCFSDTLDNLKKIGLPYIGGGYTLDEAMKPVIIEKENQTFAFFAFSDHCNSGYISLARKDAYGILPLYYDLMKRCIKSVLGTVDFICIYLHYGLENTSVIHPVEIKVAHWLIDHGADIVLGGHSHVPKAVELYKEKPFYIHREIWFLVIQLPTGVIIQYVKWKLQRRKYGL